MSAPNETGSESGALIFNEMDPIPEIPPDAESAWKKVEAKCTSEPLKLGMQLRLGGLTMRDAAGRCGISDRAIRGGLDRYGLSDIARRVTSHAVVDNHREIALKATHMQLENLDSGSVDKDLAVVGGISTDKIRDYEGWRNRRGGEENLGDCLIEIAERIVKGGGKLDLTIEGPASDPVESARDVTPQAGEGSDPCLGKWNQ